jgi:hypothetical protein
LKKPHQNIKGGDSRLQNLDFLVGIAIRRLLNRL